LAKVQSEIAARPEGRAVSVVADFSDLASVRRAAEEIIGLKLPIAGVLNNAGIFPLRDTKTPDGRNLPFCTNHLGPFAFTEALIPHLADGTNVVFIVSAVEDPERRPAAMAGFRGGRYVSAEASLRGDWAPGGSSKPGYDAYATSKQCNLATVLAFARETPRLHFRAIEPGLNPGTALGRDANPALRSLSKILGLLGPIIPSWSTPKHASQVITTIVTDPSPATGEYYNENGQPTHGSKTVQDPAFCDRVVAETRALLTEDSAATGV
jgi:NAD(P)-dependent dehydrogenase (short-subunit alcohol dehydrogenase family)